MPTSLEPITKQTNELNQDKQLAEKLAFKQLKPAEFDPQKDAQILLDLALKMGVLLIQSGAETYRVEATLTYVLEAYPVLEPSAYVADTLLLVSLKVKDNLNSSAKEVALIKNAEAIPKKELAAAEARVLTASWRVKNKGINLEKVRRLNSLSYKIVREHLSLAEFAAELAEIQNVKEHTLALYIFGGMAVAFGFAIMFGLNLKEASLIFALTGPVILLYRFLRQQINEFFIHIACAAFATALICLSLHFGYLSQFGSAIAACLMALMPGAMFTNGLRDLIMGDFNAGTNKLTQTILIGIALALGSALALLLCGSLNLR